MWDLIISGGSITHGGWPTWKDFVSERYNITPINLACKGQGNEVIATKAILESQKYNNPIIAVMFTNVDKWDWYVQDLKVLKKLTKEKHTPQPVHNNDSGGYWSTGSWFPLDKEYYLKNYYSIDYQIMHTCMQIHHLKIYCISKNIPCLILFDSPIFEYTEQELYLNIDPDLKPKSLISPSTKPFTDLIGNYDRGLIGFCSENNLPWYHPKYKPHPGSLAHYEYSMEYVFFELDKYFTVVNSDQSLIAKKMDKLWYV